MEHTNILGDYGIHQNFIHLMYIKGATCFSYIMICCDNFFLFRGIYLTEIRGSLLAARYCTASRFVIKTIVFCFSSSLSLGSAAITGYSKRQRPIRLFLPAYEFNHACLQAYVCNLVCTTVATRSWKTEEETSS